MKIKAKTFRLIAVIILTIIFSIVANFIPNHNTLSYIWGMIFMGYVYMILELINDNN